MKTKNEIYVVLDTPNKAKKLQKVLDMFGEKYTEAVLDPIGSWIYVVFKDYHKEWWSVESEHSRKGKTKVSIKELRNILALEHLKEGDFVVYSDFENIAVGLFEEYDNSFGFTISKPVYLNDLEYKSVSNGGCFDDFIRYATEEEKALLDPKEENKELEVGKWYIVDKDSEVWAGRATVNGILCYKGDSVSFGFNMNGEWWDNFKLNESYPILREATTEEVKQALVKEAEKRYNVGDKVKCLCDGRSDYISTFYHPNFGFNGSFLFVEGKKIGLEVFKDGKWAEVLPQTETETQITDKDIATLERLHDTLHDVHGYSLEFELMKYAMVLAEKLRELNTQTK